MDVDLLSDDLVCRFDRGARAEGGNDVIGNAVGRDLLGSALHDNHELLSGCEFAGEETEFLGDGEHVFETTALVGLECLDAEELLVKDFHSVLDALLGDHGAASLDADSAELMDVDPEGFEIADGGG